MPHLEDFCRQLVLRRGEGAHFSWKGQEFPPAVAAREFLPIFLRQAARTVSLVAPGHEKTLRMLPSAGGGEKILFSSHAAPGIWLPALLDAIEMAAETPEERGAREMQAMAAQASASLAKLPDEPVSVPVFHLDRIATPVPALPHGSARPGMGIDPAFAALDFFPSAEARSRAAPAPETSGHK